MFSVLGNYDLYTCLRGIWYYLQVTKRTKSSSSKCREKIRWWWFFINNWYEEKQKFK